MSVSIDKSGEAWKKAILDDNATWIQLISTKGTNLIDINKYHIIDFPSNFLLDKEGRIIKINVEKEELEAFMESL